MLFELELFGILIIFSDYAFFGSTRTGTRTRLARATSGKAVSGPRQEGVHGITYTFICICITYDR